MLVGAAIVATGTGIATADPANGDRSLAAADQAQPPMGAPVIVPITVSVIGNRVSHNDATLKSDVARATQYRIVDNRGTLNAAGTNGDDSAAPAPVLICGNAMSSSGIGTAACRGNASVGSEHAAPAPQAASAAPVQQMAPAAPAAPAQQAVPQQPAAAPMSAPAAQVARPITPGRLAFIRRSSAATPTAPLVICGNAGTVRGIASAACMGDALFQRPGPGA